MKGMIARTKNEDGTALAVAVGVVSIMVILATLVTVMARTTNQTVAKDIRLTESVNIAEAGVDDAIAMTIANYYSVYPGGMVPAALDDGQQLFTENQDMLDGQGNVVGSYQVWTKQDPTYPGDILITSKGTVSPDVNPLTSTVRVSVHYTPGNFDYTFFSGTPSLDSNTVFTANGGDEDHDEHGGGNIAVTGKVHVNGNMTINAYREGHDHDDDDDHGGHGTVSFFSRTGYTDTVRYTKTFTGRDPSGNQPALGNSVPFPVVDFTKFTGSNVITVNMPSTGVPDGGWTRNGGTFTISATDFQNAYQSYDVVKFTSSNNGVKVQIVGACGSPEITSTIMVEGVSGALNTGVSELDIIGPDITLQPTNGLAVISGRGLVSFQNEVIIGASGIGSLVYLSGQNGANSFDATGDLVMWGSLIVNGPVSMTGQGRGEDDDDHDEGDDHDDDDGDHDDDDDDDHDRDDDDHDDDHDDRHEDEDSPYCGGGEYHGGEGDHHTTNMIVKYDGAYLSNSHLPLGWWTWNGAGGFTAVKDNYVRE